MNPSYYPVLFFCAMVSALTATAGIIKAACWLLAKYRLRIERPLNDTLEYEKSRVDSWKDNYESMRSEHQRLNLELKEESAKLLASRRQVEALEEHTLSLERAHVEWLTKNERQTGELEQLRKTVSEQALQVTWFKQRWTTQCENLLTYQRELRKALATNEALMQKLADARSNNGNH